MDVYKKKEFRMGDYMKFLSPKTLQRTQCAGISNQVDQTISNWSNSKS